MPPPLFNDSKLKRDTYELEDPKVNPEKEEKGAVRTQTPERQRWSPGRLGPLPVSLLQALLPQDTGLGGGGGRTGRGLLAVSGSVPPPLWPAEGLTVADATQTHFIKKTCFSYFLHPLALSSP